MTDNFIFIALCFSIVACMATISVSILYFVKEKKRKLLVLDKKSNQFMSFPRRKYEQLVISATNDYVTSSDKLEELFYLYSSPITPLSDNAYNDSFFISLGLKLDSMKIVPNQVCCLMPFHPMYGKIFDTIRKVCTDLDMKIIRTDEMYVQQISLSKNIIQTIITSPMIISVLDGKNPNVAYETGIAHALGKSVILLVNVNQIKEIPLYFKDRQVVTYKNLNDLQTKLQLVILELKSNKVVIEKG